MLASPLPTGRLSRWLFDAAHRQHLVYNQCWEDPAVDHEALRLRPADRVLVITSAGCNALDYALTGASVLAVDVNPRQNHLLELKRAGIRALDFEAFFDLFGRGGSGRAREIYAELRRALPEASREHWDREIRLFEPDRVRGPPPPARRGSSPSRRQPGGDVAPGGARAAGLMILERPGGFPGFLRDCIDHVMAVALLRENYFWSVYHEAIRSVGLWQYFLFVGKRA